MKQQKNNGVIGNPYADENARYQKQVKKIFEAPVYAAYIITSTFDAKHINKLSEKLQQNFIATCFQSSKVKFNQQANNPIDKLFLIVDDSKGKVSLSGQFDTNPKLQNRRIVYYPNQTKLQEVIQIYDSFCQLGKYREEVSQQKNSKATNRNQHNIDVNNTGKLQKSKSHSADSKFQSIQLRRVSKMKDGKRQSKNQINGLSVIFIYMNQHESERYKTMMANIQERDIHQQLIKSGSIVKRVKLISDYENELKKIKSREQISGRKYLIYLIMGQYSAKRFVGDFKNVNEIFLFADIQRNCLHLMKSNITEATTGLVQLNSILKQKGLEPLVEENTISKKIQNLNSPKNNNNINIQERTNNNHQLDKFNLIKHQLSKISSRNQSQISGLQIPIINTQNYLENKTNIKSNNQNKQPAFYSITINDKNQKPVYQQNIFKQEDIVGKKPRRFSQPVNILGYQKDQLIPLIQLQTKPIEQIKNRQEEKQNILSDSKKNNQNDIEKNDPKFIISKSKQVSNQMQKKQNKQKVYLSLIDPDYYIFSKPKNKKEENYTKTNESEKQSNQSSKNVKVLTNDQRCSPLNIKTETPFDKNTNPYFNLPKNDENSPPLIVSEPKQNKRTSLINRDQENYRITFGHQNDPSSKNVEVLTNDQRCSPLNIKTETPFDKNTNPYFNLPKNDENSPPLIVYEPKQNYQQLSKSLSKVQVYPNRQRYSPFKFQLKQSENFKPLMKQNKPNETNNRSEQSRISVRNSFNQNRDDQIQLNPYYQNYTKVHSRQVPNKYQQNNFLKVQNKTKQASNLERQDVRSKSLASTSPQVISYHNQIYEKHIENGIAIYRKKKDPLTEEQMKLINVNQKKKDYSHQRSSKNYTITTKNNENYTKLLSNNLQQQQRSFNNFVKDVKDHSFESQGEETQKSISICPKCKSKSSNQTLYLIPDILKNSKLIKDIYCFQCNSNNVETYQGIPQLKKLIKKLESQFNLLLIVVTELDKIPPLIKLLQQIPNVQPKSHYVLFSQKHQNRKIKDKRVSSVSSSQEIIDLADKIRKQDPKQSRFHNQYS